MKTLSLAAITLFTALAIGATSCGNGDGKDGADSTKNVQGDRQGEAYATSINIRYVDMDSILTHYEYCIDQEAKVQQIDLELQQFQNQLARNLQTKQQAVAQKAQNNGYLSQQSYEADVTELQKLEQSSQAQFNRRAQADQARVFELKKAYTDAIREYIVEYNKEHKYDAILFKEAGLYFNPSLDITGEVLQGLNAAYKMGDKAEAKAEAEPAAEKKEAK